ncbi:MAG: D-alanyl-D-alanine dipeptidase [Hyphomicrobiales bacterium]|nr:D-alanyl-D-alanine dipeptidase [Rickettsiales bacterium]MCP5361329.1 D-alanyl-D-alanine dipeptidase [Hyphomicrobiales bacterium]
MLVAITPPEFDVVLDIAYATSHNFTGHPHYKHPHAYLRPEAAEALSRAITVAAGIGLRLKIFDAYRPLEVQKAFWEHTPDPEFLSPPEGGSVPHCRGVAVDLTLVNENEEALPMGTVFDAFTPLSHHGATGISPEAQRNRLLLAGIMATAGWDYNPTEWWHYQLFKPREYPVLSDAEAGTGLI